MVSALRQCHQDWLGIAMAGVGTPHDITVDESARPHPVCRSKSLHSLLWRCPATETMVHGPGPDLLACQSLFVTVLYREMLPQGSVVLATLNPTPSALRRTQLVLHASSVSTTACTSSRIRRTYRTPMALRFSPCSVNVTVWSAFKVDVRFQTAILRFLFQISSI
jgi:hypothetical protein